MGKVVEFLSGEFLLRNRPNGGTAVLLRSLWVSTLISLAVLPIRSYFAPGTSLAFSGQQLKTEVGQMIPWFGAVFAGSYAAFYSRFAAQWGYLANLYNQIMATCISLPAARPPNQTLASWLAAFIEDAQDLHLARKTMFASVIVELLKDGYVVSAFLSSTQGGPNRLRDLERQLNCAAAAPNPERVNSIVTPGSKGRSMAPLISVALGVGLTILLAHTSTRGWRNDRN